MWKSVGISGEPRGEFAQLFRRESGFDFVFRLVASAVIVVPIRWELAQDGLLGDAFGAFSGRLRIRLELLRPGLRRSVSADVFGVDFPERRMLLDLLVEQRLGDGGIVDFAVAVAAIADQIDDDVGAELVAVLGGHARDANDCVDIFGVDVEDRNRLAAGELRSEARGVLFACSWW